MPGIKVYGSETCSMTRDTREHLETLGVPYQYRDIDRSQEAARWVKQQNQGKVKTPTLDIDGRILTEPSDQALDAALAEAGVTY
jgi:mycoredoxin